MSEAMQTSRAIRRYQLAGVAGLLVLFAGASGWAAAAKIEGAVIAPATVAVKSSAKTIQHLSGGIVAAIKVSNGSKVAAGDLLLRLDDTEPRASLAILTAQLTELLAKRARLEAERDGRKAIVFPAELRQMASQPRTAEVLAGQQKLLRTRRRLREALAGQLREQIKQFRQQVTGLQAQLTAKSRQSRLIDQELRSVLTLKRKKLVTQNRVLALQRQKAQLQGELGELTSGIAEIRAKISETRVKLLHAGHQWRGEVLGELREVETRLAELLERRVAARAELGRIEIRAPQAGMVHDLAVHTIGGVIAAGAPLMYIIPEKDRLVFNGELQPADIDQVYLGQKATVRLSGLDASKTPELTGRVVFIGGDLTLANGASGSNARPPFYAIRVEVEARELARLGGQKLVPGMPAELFVRTRPRTVLSYLLSPIENQLAKTFRDG